MIPMMIAKPKIDEYAPFYAGYVAQTGEDDVIQTLAELKDSTWQFLSNLPVQKGDYAYAPGKWTVKQLLSHMIDAERVFAYRVLCFSRGDENALPGFDENDYVDRANVSTRTLDELAQEFKALREANLYLYRSITTEQSLFIGTASGKTVSVRALLYIAAGHEIHHVNVIRERYL
jgi:uncharacterized damage-inducible protein DinB